MYLWFKQAMPISNTFKSFRFSRRNFFSKICFPPSYFEYCEIVSLFTSDILIIHFIIGAYILLLCFNFSHEKSILLAANLKYTLTSSRTRAFFFFSSFSRTKIFFCANFCSNSSKTMFGNKETKETIKTAAMEVSNGGEWLRSPSG